MKRKNRQPDKLRELDFMDMDKLRGGTDEGTPGDGHGHQPPPNN